MTVDAAVLAAQNRGPTVLTVTIILLSISTAFTALRLISRFGVVKRISNDDYMIILAWVSALVVRRLCEENAEANDDKIFYS